MKTKNEFFADYFKNQLDEISREIDVFAKSNISQFGADDVYPANHILDMLSGIEEEWKKTVIENVQEGYPVIDIYKEENK